MGSTVSTRKKDFLKALEVSLGVVTSAAEKVGMQRSIHYKWMASDKKYKEAVEEITNKALDFAESKLFELIKGAELADTKFFVIDGKIETKDITKKLPPDTAATIFYLKTKGKNRGYIERVEQTGADGEPLNTNVTIQVIESDVKFAGSEKEIDV